MKVDYYESWKFFCEYCVLVGDEGRDIGFKFDWRVVLFLVINWEECFFMCVNYVFFMVWVGCFVLKFLLMLLFEMLYICWYDGYDEKKLSCVCFFL